jgi:hypothetical protein
MRCLRFSIWRQSGELPLEDRYDLGTSHMPLAGVMVNAQWCAVFAHYALIMDATVGTDPPRLARLPAESRCVTCVTLEHAMVSYSSLWQGGRHIWQIRHHQSQGAEHLEVSGDLPADFTRIRDIAVQRRRAEEEAIRKQGRRPDEWTVNHAYPLSSVARAKDPARSATWRSGRRADHGRLSF